MLKRFFLAVLLLVAAGRAAAVDYTDIWYIPAEAGWGVNVVQSDAFMFITFFGLLFRDTGKQQKTVLYLRNEDSSSVLPAALAVSLRDDADVDLRTQAAPKDAYELVVPKGAADTLAAGST